MIGALPVITAVLGVKVALDPDRWSLMHALMLLPAAIVAWMFIASYRDARAASGSPAMLVVRRWFPSAAQQLRGAFATPIIVGEQVGTDSPTLAFGSRLAGRMELPLRVPAATVRSVRWEPDSGSSTQPPTKEWLVILDARKDATPELATLAEQQRHMVARAGVRAQALVLTQNSKRAEREGLRLVEFLRAVGLTLELDPAPSVDDPDALDRAVPPTSPDGIDEPVLTPARLAAAERRVRWRVVPADKRAPSRTFSA